MVQSAYIEGLIKLFADYSFWKATADQPANKLMDVTRKRFETMSLSELVRLLHDADLIKKTQKSNLDKYRNKRNKVMHDLITEIHNSNFDEELRGICELGTMITEDEEFKRMAKLVEFLEIQSEEKPKANQDVKNEESE